MGEPRCWEARVEWSELTMGRRFAVALKALDLTPEQAAERVGISATTLWAIRADRQAGGRLATLRLICAKLNIRLCWLIEGEGEIFKLPEVPETTKTGTPGGVPARQPSKPLTPAASRKKSSRHDAG